MTNMNFVRSFMIGSYAHVLLGSTASSTLALVTFDMDLNMALKHVYNWTEYAIEDVSYVWAGEFEQGSLPIQDDPFLITMLWRHKTTQQYVLKFTYFVSRVGVFMPDYMTWTVDSAFETGPLQIELNEHYYSWKSNYPFSNTRVLLMVANETVVHIFAVDPDEPEGTPDFYVNQITFIIGTNGPPPSPTVTWDIPNMEQTRVMLCSWGGENGRPNYFDLKINLNVSN